ncbi:MAG: hypothetical protein DWI48_03495 [Chloroflexi bacterium]|nr:MAG: hypothetical protein DWI48_03495 [Chloroflexota bacterium]
MAVSVLEASAARVVGQYLAVSRIRPLRELVDLVGVEFCRTHQVAPLWRDGGAVAVASARPRAQDVLREIRERLGQTVVLRLSSPAEILIAIDNAVGEDAAISRRGALAELLQEVQLVRHDQAAAYALAADDEAYLGAALVDAKLLTEAERIEAVGLAFHLPSISLDAHPPRPGLDGILDVAMLRRLRVLPLWSTQDELFFACDTPPTIETIEALDAALGVVLRPVLVTPHDLTERLARLIDDDAADGVQLSDAARREHLAPDAQIEAAERISRQTGEPFRSTLRRIANVTDEAMQEALARTSGLRVFRDEIVQEEALNALPVNFARRIARGASQPRRSSLHRRDAEPVGRARPPRPGGTPRRRGAARDHRARPARITLRARRAAAAAPTARGRPSASHGHAATAGRLRRPQPRVPRRHGPRPGKRADAASPLGRHARPAALGRSHTRRRRAPRRDVAAPTAARGRRSTFAQRH